MFNTIANWVHAHRQQILGVALALALALVVVHPSFAASGDLNLDLNFDGALIKIFDYAEMLFTPLVSIAAIGIGFRFAGDLVRWVGDMLGGAFRR
jgi:hypothetical protein